MERLWKRQDCYRPAKSIFQPDGLEEVPTGEKTPKKFEARNSKYETSPKFEFPMFKTRDVPNIYL